MVVSMLPFPSSIDKASPLCLPLPNIAPVPFVSQVNYSSPFNIFGVDWGRDALNLCIGASTVWLRCLYSLDALNLPVTKASLPISITPAVAVFEMLNQLIGVQCLEHQEVLIWWKAFWSKMYTISRYRMTRKNPGTAVFVTEIFVQLHMLH